MPGPTGTNRAVCPHHRPCSSLRFVFILHPASSVRLLGSFCSVSYWQFACCSSAHRRTGHDLRHSTNQAPLRDPGCTRIERIDDNDPKHRAPSNSLVAPHTNTKPDQQPQTSLASQTPESRLVLLDISYCSHLLSTTSCYASSILYIFTTLKATRKQQICGPY